MPQTLVHTIQGTHWVLDARRAAFWSEQQLLVVSDLHVGKTTHFRKNGIAIAGDTMRADFERLSALLLTYEPNTLLITGDFFHSSFNQELDFFLQWRQQFRNIHFQLIRGNHDKQTFQLLAEQDMSLIAEELHLFPFVFIHDPTSKQQEDFYIGGHIHPAIQLAGVGKQKTRLPCFFHTKKQFILPAFGQFTGTSTVQPQKGDQVIAIANQELIVFE